MSNEKNFTSMKIYLKKLGKLFFWNFLSVAILGGGFSLMVWESRLHSLQRGMDSGVEQVTIENLFTNVLLWMLPFVIILGTMILGLWSYLRSFEIWKKHPDKQQKLLLVSSDLIVGIGCWIALICYYSQYPALFSVILILPPLISFIGKLRWLFYE